VTNHLGSSCLPIS